MAIEVTGYGPITQTNAREIYLAYSRGQLELDKSQQTKCESFLSPEELDEISYDEEVRENKSASKINTKNEDGETVEDNGNGAEYTGMGVSIAASAGTIMAVVTTILNAAGKACCLSGFIGLPAAIITTALAATALVMAIPSIFDGQLADREAKKDEAPNANETIQGYTDGLGASMEMMEEDAALYEEQSAQLTLTKNEQTSRGAELQMQYDTAMAMGDKAGAEKAKSEMQQLEKADNSQMEEELAATGESIGEYKAMNAESVGVVNAGKTVSDFLIAGNKKANIATASAWVCTAAAATVGICAALAAIPKLGLADALPSGMAGTLFGVTAAILGTTAGFYFSDASKERECGVAGDDMTTYIDGLNDMIGQQNTYTADTEAAFAESDEASAESQEKAGKQADKSVAQNNKNLEQEEPEEATNANTPTAA